MSSEPATVWANARKMWALATASERKAAAVLLALMILGMTLETLGIGLVIPAIALLTQADIAAQFPGLRPLLAALGNPDRATLVTGGMLALTAMYLVKTFFIAFLVWKQNRFAYRLQARLSQQLFATYLRQPYAFHLQRNSSALVATATRDVEFFIGYGVIPALTLLTEVLILAGVATLLMFVEPVGALIVVVVLGGAAYAFHGATQARSVGLGGARQRHEALRLQHLEQGLGGAKDVKLFGREEEFLSQYRSHNQATARIQEVQATLQQLPRLLLELLAVVGLTILVLTMLSKGTSVDRIVPALGVFAAAAFRLMPSANRVIAALQAMRYGLAVVNTLHRELSVQSAPSPRRRTAVASLQSAIELHDVCFTYPGAHAPALQRVSLSVRKGESVGFIGPSGAGKSTLVDIILGLLTPTTGRVTVDRRDIQDDLRGWQDQLGYVPQSIYLTDDTIRRNVAFGIPDDQIDDTAVMRAIRAAQLDAFVATLPGGVETLVGERGVRLSGGQRQRIAIARALYHDPAVLLLDEATSALDAATEKDVVDAVLELRHEKTIMVVAHRLSTVEHCDRLYALDGGALAAEGPTAELLRVYKSV